LGTKFGNAFLLKKSVEPVDDTLVVSNEIDDVLLNPSRFCALGWWANPFIRLLYNM
jgi:hypothetical protein